MVYATEGLKLLAPGVESQPSLWTYTTTDTISGTVDAAGYFTDGAARGLKVGDCVLAAETGATDGWTAHYVGVVTALDASPYSRIQPAILN